jgi:hypothetical protein
MDVLTSEQVLPSRYIYLGVDIYVSCQHLHSYIHHDNILASQLCFWLLSLYPECLQAVGYVVVYWAADRLCTDCLCTLTAHTMALRRTTDFLGLLLFHNTCGGMFSPLSFCLLLVTISFIYDGTLLLTTGVRFFNRTMR